MVTGKFTKKPRVLSLADHTKTLIESFDSKLVGGRSPLFRKRGRCADRGLAQVSRRDSRETGIDRLVEPPVKGGHVDKKNRVQQGPSDYPD
jgi:hypothetical protein